MKNLVIVRAGRNSTHLGWLGGTKQFDLIIFAYEQLPLELTQTAQETILIKGTKVAGWKALFAERPDLLEDYGQIALLDDDLICTTDDINKTFEFGGKYGLSLWQPSLTWDSYFSYAATLHNPLFKLRYVNFIEMMCPFFSAAQLKLALPLFSLGFETTVDRLWCRLRSDAREAYAVIDEVTFRHSRPVGVNAAAQGFMSDPRYEPGNMYQAKIDEIEADSGIRFRGPVAYAGITRNGKKIQSRVVMSLYAFALFAASIKKLNKNFYRPVTDHIRHILTRPIDNNPINLAAFSKLSSAK